MTVMASRKHCIIVIHRRNWLLLIETCWPSYCLPARRSSSEGADARACRHRRSLTRLSLPGRVVRQASYLRLLGTGGTGDG